jgi:hypothetical protein
MTVTVKNGEWHELRAVKEYHSSNNILHNGDEGNARVEAEAGNCEDGKESLRLLTRLGQIIPRFIVLAVVGQLLRIEKLIGLVGWHPDCFIKNTKGGIDKTEGLPCENGM